jgi:hypothetical protein
LKSEIPWRRNRSPGLQIIVDMFKSYNFSQLDRIYFYLGTKHYTKLSYELILFDDWVFKYKCILIIKFQFHKCQCLCSKCNVLKLQLFSVFKYKCILNIKFQFYKYQYLCSKCNVLKLWGHINKIYNYCSLNRLLNNWPI